MGNSIPSCVECVEEDSATFPRGNGMNTSSSMTALPSSSSRPVIPNTKETVNDTVLVSCEKPLGATLCDSISAKGVFVTAIKEGGNLEKASQKRVSLGMLLVELNEENVTNESLESVIGKISDTEEGKKIKLLFRGTTPADSPSESSSKEDGSKPTSSQEKEKKDADVSTGAKKDSEESKSKTSNADSDNKLDSKSEDTKQLPCQNKESDDEKKVKDLEQNKSATNEEKSKEDKIVDNEETEKQESHRTPEIVKRSESDEMASTSMDTVDMSTPAANDTRDEKDLDQKDLDDEFSKVSLSEGERSVSDDKSSKKDDDDSNEKCDESEAAKGKEEESINASVEKQTSTEIASPEDSKAENQKNDS